MINGGAEWLHMGTTFSFTPYRFDFQMFSAHQMSWMGESRSVVSAGVMLIRNNKIIATLCLTLLWVKGSPILPVEFGLPNVTQALLF